MFFWLELAKGEKDNTGSQTSRSVLNIISSEYSIMSKEKVSIHYKTHQISGKCLIIFYKTPKTKSSEKYAVPFCSTILTSYNVADRLDES